LDADILHRGIYFGLMRVLIILAAACLMLVSCQKEEGCTDSSANNFDPTAEIDDGSCEYDVEGCADPEAVNYNSEATVDDGSCMFLEDLQPSIDGYTYGVVQIGDQVWFSENLRTTVYANGDVIPAGLTDGEWISTNEGATSVYGEGSSGCENYSPDIDACDEVQSLAEYGRLYIWHVVDDARGLCPVGWHVPTDEEWTDLEDFIAAQGFFSNPGAALKSTYGWSEEYGGSGTDNFGFSALPGGYRSSDGSFFDAGNAGYWWSSSPSGGNAWFRRLSSYFPGIGRSYYNPRIGFSVRCLRDAE
jgi:uncharacterized protein (TIGR02145 family)